MVCAVPVTQEGCIKLTQELASDLQALRRGPEATTENLEGREAKLTGLDLNVQLLTENAGSNGDL